MSIFAGIIVSAADTSAITDIFKKGFVGFLRGEGGIEENIGIVGWIFFLLILAFMYSAFTFFKFPKNPLLRVFICLAITVLAVGMISQEELIAALTSYGALGITFIMVIPIIVLAFFSLMVSVQAAPMGLLAQRLIWIIYGAYLFIRSSLLLLASGLLWFGPTNNSKFFSDLYGFFGLSLEKLQMDSLTISTADNTILIINIIVSIAVIVIFVFMNDMYTAWIMEKARQYDLKAFEDTQKRATGVEETRAKSTKKE